MVAARETLEARARILRAVRGWFEAQDFLEVETPARVRSPGQEVHLDAIAAGEGHWLITSPEYHMKRLVAAGLPRIVQIGKCWRADESGPHHRGEFTMIEWYRAAAPLERAGRRLRGAAARRRRGRRARRRRRWAWRGRSRAPPCASCGRATRASSSPATRTPGLCARRPRAAGVALGSATAWDDIFYQVFLDRIEPRLAAAGPDLRLRLAGAAGRARPAEAGRPARRRALRAVRGRARAGQRVRRADRSGRAAAPVRGRSAHPGRPRPGRSTRSTRRCWRRCRGCRRRPESPWGSTAWSCSCSGARDIGEVVAFGDEREWMTP